VTTSQDMLPLESHGVARSTFVTALAWVLIAVSGFGAFISLMQAVMLIFIFPSEHFWNAPAPHGVQNIPPLVQFLSSNVQYFFLAFWLLTALTLVSSIGLLRRKNWARLTVVGIFGLGVVWNLGGIWLQWRMFSPTELPAKAPADFTREMETMMTVMRVATTIFAVAVAVLLAWLIRRLVSPRIRREFGAL
jgi:hypothetical protein